MPKLVSQKSSLSPRGILARNIRVLRAHANLSQEQLAFTCGLHRTYIGGIERSERNVSLDNIERIAAALGAEVWQLLKPNNFVRGAHIPPGTPAV